MNTQANARPRETRRAARDRVRTSLIVAANELFESAGFESATTEDIAARAGVSQRTFYRYFECKEDVVLHWLDSYNELICERLREKPFGEAPLRVLQYAVNVYRDISKEESELARLVQKLVRESWTLRARLLCRLEEWEARIAAELIARGVNAIDAAHLAGFAVAILSTSFREAHRRKGVSAGELIDAGFAVLNGRRPAQSKKTNPSRRNGS